MLDTILQQKEEDRKSNLKTTGEMYKDKENYLTTWKQEKSNSTLCYSYSTEIISTL